MTLLKALGRWGSADAVENEYIRYSESQIQVYHGDQLISSTDNGVRTSRLSCALLYSACFIS